MELMKNGLSKSAVKRISKALSQVLNNDNVKYKKYKVFNIDAFENACLHQLESLELKERVNHIINVLHQFLPNDFILKAEILTSITQVWDFGEVNDPLKNFAAWPIIDYFSVYGLTQPEVSLNALKKLTHLFSAEFAIRPFIIKYPELCHELFLEWIHDKSSHIRRLVSEGTRPKLPWGIQLKKFVADPTPNLVLLDHLKSDTSLYVRRSVANHLNDIAKNHPDIVINTCKKWSQLKNKDVDWVIKHATRTLVKNGNVDVFPLLGFTEKPEILIEEFKTSESKIKLGNTIKFAFCIKSLKHEIQTLVIDYAVYFNKANNKQQAKVFKLKNIILQPHQSINLTKSFSFKAITTRKYYCGEHKIELLVNGKPLLNKSFTVI